MSKEQLAPFSEAVQALVKLCQEGQTGTLYVLTQQEHGAVFALSQGRIVDIFFRTVRGMQALPMMSEIDKARYFFKTNPGGANAQPNGSLPENSEIFKALGVTGGAEGESSATGKKCILLVEDSALARKTVEQMLAGKGYRLLEAKDGFEALGKLGEEKPDLVLLDLILPKMDGYAVLSAMKKDDNYKHIPVIVLTSRDALFDKLKGKMSGTDEYLTKPIKPKELLEKLSKYLN